MKSIFYNQYNKVDLDIDFHNSDVGLGNRRLGLECEKRNVENVINGKFDIVELEKLITKMVDRVYKLGRRKVKVFNPNIGRNISVKYLVRFQLSRKELGFPTLYNRFGWKISEKIYLGNESYSYWKGNDTANIYKVRVCKTLSELVTYISEWMTEWDKVESEKHQIDFLKTLKYSYGVDSLEKIDSLLRDCYDDYLRVWKYVDENKDVVENNKFDDLFD